MAKKRRQERRPKAAPRRPVAARADSAPPLVLQLESGWEVAQAVLSDYGEGIVAGVLGIYFFLFVLASCGEIFDIPALLRFFQ